METRGAPGSFWLLQAPSGSLRLFQAIPWPCQAMYEWDAAAECILGKSCISGFTRIFSRPSTGLRRQTALLKALYKPFKGHSETQRVWNLV